MGANQVLGVGRRQDANRQGDSGYDKCDEWIASRMGRRQHLMQDAGGCKLAAWDVVGRLLGVSFV